jgi:hypothetical protein
LYFLQHFFLHSIPPLSTRRAFSAQKPIRSGKSIIRISEYVFRVFSTSAKLKLLPWTKNTSAKNHLNRGWKNRIGDFEKKNTLGG